MRDHRSTPVIAAALVGLLCVGGYVAAWHLTTNTVVCEVTGKDRTTVSNGDGGSRSDARLYTSCGVLTVSDDLLRLNFTSADTYAGIGIGGAYKLTTVGWRAPLLSTFPNVIEATATT